MERLLRHPDAPSMLADHAMCEHVVEWKSRMFARLGDRYDLAKPGTFRVLPPDERNSALARDYAQMRAMFIATPPEFEVVMARLRQAERTLNAPSAWKRSDPGRTQTP